MRLPQLQEVEELQKPDREGARPRRAGRPALHQGHPPAARGGSRESHARAGVVEAVRQHGGMLRCVRARVRRHEHHHADEVFTSWGKQTPKKYSKSQLEKILKELSDSSAYGNILRAKGYVDSIEGDWWYFDLVPGEYEIRIGKPDFTGRICVIGEKLDKIKLDRLFDEVA